MKVKYKTAKELHILPEEHKALRAFVAAPALGRTISVNGHAHYYNQSYVGSDYHDELEAKKNDCGTAGCVAAFVFAHVRHVQRKKTLRKQREANKYYHQASNAEDKNGKYTVLSNLFDQNNEGYTLAQAKKVVHNMLRTGKVNWPAPARELPEPEAD